MKTHSKPEWFERSAIIWDHSQVQNATCSYWDPNVLSALSAWQLVGGGGADAFDDTCDRSSISYESMFLITLALVDALREQLLSSLSLNNVDNSHQLRARPIGLPIVVAIPEGPLLPLAVLAVHILNEPIDDANISAILVPIEPTEGKERLRHMLNDVKPVLVLAMPGSYLDLMNEIISTISFEGELISPHGMLQPTSCKIIDFLDFLRQAIDHFDKERMVQFSLMRDGVDPKKQSIRELILENCMARTIPDHEALAPRPLKASNRMSHIVFTSGTTGQPKGCISSIRSLQHYLQVKNEAHGISSDATVLLASALSFDPCLSDILATFEARATLAIAPRQQMLYNMPQCLKALRVTHILCTPALWGLVHSSGAEPCDFPFLRVIALGGEPIPKRMITKWARDICHETRQVDNHACRLFATYGVTEACVYQTFGEIFNEPDAAVGPHVGTPLRGLRIRLCSETDQTELRDVSAQGEVGEVVVSGVQVDEWSSYLNQPELSSQKFSTERLPDIGDCFFYRTGDRGIFDASNGNLTILGRIHGETGMVKINGVRIELGEIEAALVDDVSTNNNLRTVVDAIAVATFVGEEGSKQIHAFCVLSNNCLKELGIDTLTYDGALCTRGPLLTLLQARCTVRCKVSPSAFVIIPLVPFSPTGKRDRRKLPKLEDCVPLESLALADASEKPQPLPEYGNSGKVVAESIVECLNLQPCQQTMLTTNARFSLLGGDSLAATRVVRALYAYHHNVFNTRHLGGEFGTLEGPFNVVHLLRADSLKEYVDWLDSCNVCKPRDNGAENKVTHEDQVSSVGDGDGRVFDNEGIKSIRLYEALIEAATLGLTSTAVALLEMGADPNFDDHGGRLGKISDRKERRQVFRSSPLHLACAKGDYQLVEKLLQKGGKYNAPDASGSFPVHLAASGVFAGKEEFDEYNFGDDVRRLKCIKMLLEAGAPLSMKDGNKQTVLHCAARSGHCKVIHFVMDRWRTAGEQNELRIYDDVKRGGRFDWADRWFRTPVHWAILNKRVDALRILLAMGCSPNPPKVTNNRQTSAAVETPLELCIRLYGEVDGVGQEISNLLRQSLS